MKFWPISTKKQPIPHPYIHTTYYTSAVHIVKQKQKISANNKKVCFYHIELELVKTKHALVPTIQCQKKLFHVYRLRIGCRNHVFATKRWLRWQNCINLSLLSFLCPNPYLPMIDSCRSSPTFALRSPITHNLSSDLVRDIPSCIILIKFFNFFITIFFCRSVYLEYAHIEWFSC